jgi:FixJ family two-component response regulator
VIQQLFTVVIDDDPSVCTALRRLLRSAGMEAVLDIRMPGMSGPELRERLLRLGRRIPVVFITAHAEAENGLRDGKTEILRKPFDGQVLLDAIHRAANGG